MRIIEIAIVIECKLFLLEDLSIRPVDFGLRNNYSWGLLRFQKQYSNFANSLVYKSKIICIIK